MPPFPYPEPYGTPFSAAKIFLSFSWKDIEVAKILQAHLMRKFKVISALSHLIDGPHGSGLVLGDSVWSEKAIEQADDFVFISSPYSLDPSRAALKELMFARGLANRGTLCISIVRLDHGPVPPWYSDALYESVNTETVEEDARHLSEDIERQLAAHASLFPWHGQSEPAVYLTGYDIELMLHGITHPRHQGIFTLNAIIRAPEKQRLLRSIRALRRWK